VVLVITLAVASCDIGMILLAHVNFTSWAYIGLKEMDAVHRNWEGAVHQIIFPLQFLTGTCTIGTIALRHPRVPWSMIGLSAAVQLSIFVTTALMWSRWQHRLGESGYVHMPDGSLNPLYERIMDTHWVRIVLICVYGATVLAMVVTTVLRREPLLSRSARPAVATV
jgi:hypothetical protein